MPKQTYTTMSIPKGLKDDLAELKGENDSYADVLYRLMATRDYTPNEVESRLDHVVDQLNRQGALLARLAKENDIPDDNIPDDMLERAGWNDPTDPFASIEQDVEELADKRDDDNNGDTN